MTKESPGGRPKRRPPRSIPREEFVRKIRSRIRPPRVPPKTYKVSYRNPASRRWEPYRKNLSYKDATLLAARVRYVVGPKEYGREIETKVEPDEEA